MLHVLEELFDRVVLHTNMGKTVIMAFHPYCATGGHFIEAYGVQMTSEGSNHQERLRLRIRCPEFKAGLAAGSLANHQQVQHWVGMG